MKDCELDLLFTGTGPDENKADRLNAVKVSRITTWPQSVRNAMQDETIRGIPRERHLRRCFG